ncbi:MAG: hypothetical protein ACRDOO_28490 [Actinomadura sp.]
MALALVLLIVGGLALFGALTSGPERGSPGASPQTGSNVSVTRSAGKTTQAAVQHTLALKVTGAPTRVIVLTGGGDRQVLLDQVLGTGDIQYFDDAPLDVVVADGGSVDIYVHGKRQRRGTPGERAQYHVPAR